MNKSHAGYQTDSGITYEVFFTHALLNSQFVVIHTWYLLSLNIDGSTAFDKREFDWTFWEFQVWLNRATFTDLQDCNWNFDGAMYRESLNLWFKVVA